MRVTVAGVIITTPLQLKTLIRHKYRNVRNFSKKLGFTESAVSHILHGRRRIYPWCEDKMIDLLDITKEQFRQMIGG